MKKNFLLPIIEKNTCLTILSGFSPIILATIKNKDYQYLVLAKIQGTGALLVGI